jgi:pimeloyl-ACP methyl ester carboxylesterase
VPPIALFWGERDSIIRAKHGREAFRDSTGNTLTTYSEAGHFPLLDAPCDPHRPPVRIPQTEGG